jgi:hypothetical protein
MDHCYDVWDPSTFDNLSSATWTGSEEALLVMFALQYSDFGSILSTRHGLLLDATRRIIGNRVSQPLSLNPTQWELEVRRLFDMSLLRTKFEMLAVVRGSRANSTGYGDILPSVRRGVCGKFIFKAKGYKNMSFIGILLTIFVPIFLGTEIRGEPPIVHLLVGISRLPALARSTYYWTISAVLTTFSLLRKRLRKLRKSRTTGLVTAGYVSDAAQNAHPSNESVMGERVSAASSSRKP